MARTFTRTITTPAAARTVRSNPRPVVSMVTDFGARDPSAGIMHAVVLGIAPEALIIDISHEVDKFRVRDAALLLWSAVPYLPGGAHVAVVDPGVGTERRAIAIETARGDFLVGPDNGILLPAAWRLGGITRVQLLASPQYRLPVISSSFHGRDLFAPAAAHLAMGLPLEYLGPGLDPRSLIVLDWPEPQVFAGILRSQVIYLDTFGNVKLSALTPDLNAALGYLQVGERLWIRLTDGIGSQDAEVTWADTFGRVGVGQLLLTEDSYGRLSLAINQGSAVQAIGVREDAEVLITRHAAAARGCRADRHAAARRRGLERRARGTRLGTAREPDWAPGPEQPPHGWGPPPDAGAPPQGWGPPPGGRRAAAGAGVRRPTPAGRLTSRRPGLGSAAGAAAPPRVGSAAGCRRAARPRRAAAGVGARTRGAAAGSWACRRSPVRRPPRTGPPPTRRPPPRSRAAAAAGGADLSRPRPRRTSRPPASAAGWARNWAARAHPPR